MGKTSGPVLHPFCTASLPNSAKPDGEFLYHDIHFPKWWFHWVHFWNLFWFCFKVADLLKHYDCTGMKVNLCILEAVWFISVRLLASIKIKCIHLCFCFQVRVVGPQYQKDRVVQRGGGEAASLGQADAHPVEDHCSHHWTHCCPVPGALWIPAVRFFI